MDGEHFKRTIKGLGFTQAEFGEYVGVTVKSANVWGRKGAPLYVVRILENLLASHIPNPPGPLRKATQEPGHFAREAVRTIVQGVIDEAALKGWDRAEIVDAIAAIVEEERARQ